VNRARDCNREGKKRNSGKNNNDTKVDFIVNPHANKETEGSCLAGGRKKRRALGKKRTGKNSAIQTTLSLMRLGQEIVSKIKGAQIEAFGLGKRKVESLSNKQKDQRKNRDREGEARL